MRRLLERQQAGELATRHVRAVAETVGVSERTVWRWLEQAKTTGQVEAPVRRGYAVSDEVWALLGEVGENVAELRRRLAAAGGASVPSASTLHRVIRRDRRAGRALMVEREPVVAGPRRPDPLSELGLNVVAGQGTGGQVILREQKHLAQVPVLVPGAQVVHTSAVRSVLRTVAHAAAVGAVVCLYGDAGQGKTVALQYALSQLPHPARAHGSAVKHDDSRRMRGLTTRCPPRAVCARPVCDRRESNTLPRQDGRPRPSTTSRTPGSWTPHRPGPPRSLPSPAASAANAATGRRTSRTPLSPLPTASADHHTHGTTEAHHRGRP
ncbi:hypothetical protein P1S61_16315 [Streptomyces sp. ME08-AFT2]|uniref:hypothetical protein n=1 Tax=Streptomyces sp. ME08-AFT2 TaxID=3028683 RepID=UPI0029A14087|nr:hypothetical protein [Streptomyces sp. ME08-AFT2]MDX3310613.1 hypothetical protein [Streptomyces sp. ME08-AFT2]